MGRKKQPQNEPSTLEVPRVKTETQEPSVAQPPRYVVTRDGHRVSDVEYETPDDPKAIAELEFWKKVEVNHSWGAPVVIVPYNNKIHRVWDEK